jgi:RNA-directed DNA polymerase
VPLQQGCTGCGRAGLRYIEAYGAPKWLGELALAFKEETYQPEPIRRVFIAKANGNLRPLCLSTLRDRVCMKAAMLVLEPIFEADLPEEQYAYRPGRSAQQAVVDVKDTLFQGHPEVVDADLTDYFGSIPHVELMLSLARHINSRSKIDIPRQLGDSQPTFGVGHLPDATEPCFCVHHSMAEVT